MYVKIVLYCSVFLYVALLEFAFGVVESEWQGVNPVTLTNVGIFLLYVNRSEDTSWKRRIDSPPNKGCSAAGHWKQHLGFVLQFTFLVRSFVVALCWNSKDYWCLKEVAARCVLVISKTLVIITVLVWCWRRIHGILLWYIWMHRLLASDWGWPASSSLSVYCTRIVMCLYQSTGQCLYLSVLNLISQHHVSICIYILMHINKQIMSSNKEIYIVWKFEIVCYISFLLLAVLQLRLWEGSCLFRVLKDVKSRSHLICCVCLNCGPSSRSACVKVCYFSYCSQFAEIDPPFQLNIGILGLMFWTGLCINW
jgi:hypothetical protein